MMKGKLGIRMVMEEIDEDECDNRSLPSSTMETKWPMPGEGYSTIFSIVVKTNEILCD